ncbi:hypothetical protein Tco_0846241 [Tanacetum coccineum]
MGYRATAPGFYQRNNANPSYQERRKSIEETLRKFMSESEKRHEENSNLIKEIRASTNAAIRNQGASIKNLEIQIGQMSKIIRPFLWGLHRTKRPLEIRRDQVDDLMPTIKEGEVVEEFRARNDAKMVSKVFGYPSDCDHDKKIHINCAYNMKFSCMLDFVVLEDMDAYCNEGMGDVIFGEPFLREVRINAIRFEGIITIYNGNEEVTYQMVRSHSRFKHHTNEQCNKIPPLLKDLLKVKKSTKLSKNLRSVNFEVLES